MSSATIKHRHHPRGGCYALATGYAHTMCRTTTDSLARAVVHGAGLQHAAHAHIVAPLPGHTLGAVGHVSVCAVAPLPSRICVLEKWHSPASVCVYGSSGAPRTLTSLIIYHVAPHVFFYTLEFSKRSMKRSCSSKQPYKILYAAWRVLNI